MRGYHCADGRWGGCGKVFRNIGGFDAHRVGTFSPISTRRCMTNEEMEAAGFAETNGFWGRPSNTAPSARRGENENS